MLSLAPLVKEKCAPSMKDKDRAEMAPSDDQLFLLASAAIAAEASLSGSSNEATKKWSAKELGDTTKKQATGKKHIINSSSSAEKKENAFWLLLKKRREARSHALRGSHQL